MNLKTIITAAVLATMGGATVAASSVEGETPQQQAKRMDWFSKAKLGIFIHWVPYSYGLTS